MWFVFLIYSNNINLIHNSNAKFSGRVRCLFLVKMYGNSPRTLFVRIMRNSEVRMNEFPLFSFLFPRIVFISFLVYSLIGNCTISSDAQLPKHQNRLPHRHICRGVNYGLLLRKPHTRGAYLFFLCIYIQIGRNVYYG